MDIHGKFIDPFFRVALSMYIYKSVKKHKSQFSKPKIKRLPGSGIQNMHMKFEINKNSKQNWSYALETMPSANGQADRQGESSLPPTNPHQLYKKAMRKWPWFDL